MNNCELTNLHRNRKEETVEIQNNWKANNKMAIVVLKYQ